MYKQYFLSLILIICSSILIWINGPILKIGNSIPLLDPLKRLYVIILICLGWVLKCILTNQPSKKIPVEKLNLPDFHKKIQFLQGRFYGALSFLKKTMIEKQGKRFNLSRLPWYLVIGPTGSGKTTLLANSNIHFILAKQYKTETTKTITSSEHCDWWITRDLVLVDVPGNYLTSLWQHLLSLLKKNNGKQLLQGIIITLNLPEIIKQERSHKNKIILDLKKRITDLTDTWGKTLPIHLVITKCDLLPGFTDFFSESSSEEVAQSWGITLEPQQDNLINAFTHQFNMLIKRINKQLLWRIHQERNTQARSSIKDFPLHLERLKESIAQFLKALMIPHFPLQGVYLTSSSQEFPEEEPSYVTATGAPAHFHTQSLQIMSAPPMPARSYFVKQLLLNHLPKTLEKITTPNNPFIWRNRLIYAASASTIITACFFLGHDFQFSVQQAYSIQNDLNQYQLSIQQSNQQTDRLINALPLLNALQLAANRSTHQLSLSYYSNKSQKTADAVYQQALQTIVLPEIKGFFEQYLKTANTNNPEQTYAILKAYLMLGDKSHFKSDYIAKSLQLFMPPHATPNVISALIHHIQSALNGSKTSIALDNDLIKQTRKQLTDLPTPTLAFLILKNMENNNTDSAIGLGTHLNIPSVFFTKAVETVIPSLYTAENFQKILTDESSTAAMEATQGNWVLGLNLIVTSQSTIHSLAAQLRTQYIANYVDIWESLLANIQLTTPHTLAETNTLIGILTDNHSPLIQLLNTIKENTSFSPIISASPKLQNLSILLVDASHHETSTLYQIFTALKQLQTYLNNILNSPNQQKAAFDASADRMQNPAHNPLTQIQAIADQSPEPMKTWLNTIAQQAWHFLLQNSAEYINQTWQKEIIPTYHADIENRYPFNQKATQEVGLSPFVAFLGQQGLMANFYQHYLKPFVNEVDNGVWQWRTLDNQKIPLAENTLTQFEHIASLQHAFFPNGDNKLYVQFALEPISIDNNTKNFTLNMNGQQLSYQKTMPHASRMLTWPGNNATHETSYHFTAPNNQLAFDTIKGDWGWFKLVTTATKSINSRKELSLTFNNNGHTATYLLFTQGHMNPFLPLNLARLELPDQLV
jgi:type VI secretion system protein ImpL